MCKYFINFFKIFQKSLMSRFVLNVFSQPKFWRRHCSTGLERNSCMKFFLMFPPTQKKILAPPLYTVGVYILYIYFVTCAPQIFIRGRPHATDITQFYRTPTHGILFELRIVENLYRQVCESKYTREVFWVIKVQLSHNSYVLTCEIVHS